MDEPLYHVTNSILKERMQVLYHQCLEWLKSVKDSGLIKKFIINYSLSYKTLQLKYIYIDDSESDFDKVENVNYTTFKYLLSEANKKKKEVVGLPSINIIINV